MSAEDSGPISSRTRAGGPASYPSLDLDLVRAAVEAESRGTHETGSVWDGTPFHGNSPVICRTGKHLQNYDSNIVSLNRCRRTTRSRQICG